MQFDNSVSDLLKDIGKALNNHVDKIKTQQKIYIETYNALMNIPVIKQIIDENNKLKNELHDGHKKMKTEMVIKKIFL